MIMTERSSMRASPPTMAPSSAYMRSACSLLNSEQVAFTWSRVWGRCGWRASWVICQGVRLAKMLMVSCRLFACSRAISSWMLTSDSEVTCRSSSILASSSAIGCSKSRKETAMGRKRNLTWQSAQVGREGATDGDRWGRVHHLYRIAPEQPLELLEQLTARALRPLLPEVESAGG